MRKTIICLSGLFLCLAFMVKAQKSDSKYFNWEECNQEITKHLAKNDLTTATYWSRERISRAEDDYGKRTYQTLRSRIDEAWYSFHLGERKDIAEKFSKVDELFENAAIKKNTPTATYKIDGLFSNNALIMYYLEDKKPEKISLLIGHNLSLIDDFKGREFEGESVFTYATTLRYYDLVEDAVKANQFLAKLEDQLGAAKLLKNESYSIAYKCLGDHYFEMGDYQKSTLYYQKLLSLSTPNWYFEHDKPTILIRLATGAFEQGNYPEALEWSKRSMDFLKQKTGRRHPAYLDALGQYVNILDNNPSKEIATEPLHWELLHLIEKRKGNNSTEYATAFFRWLGNKTKQTNAAFTAAQMTFVEKNIESSLRLITTRLGQGHFQTINALVLVGLYRLANNEPQKGTSLLAEANNRLKQKTIDQIGLMNENELAELIRYYETKLDLNHSIFIANRDKSPELVGLVYDNYLILKGLLLNSAAILRASVTSSTQTENQVSIKKLTQLRKELERLYVTDDADTLKVQTLEQQKATLEKELLAKSPTLAAVREGFNKSWTDIQKKIGGNQAVIEFIRFRYHHPQTLRPTDTLYYAALVLKKESKYPQLVMLSSEKQLSDFLSSGKLDTEQLTAYVRRIYEGRGIGKKVAATPVNKPSPTKKPAKPTQPAAVLTPNEERQATVYNLVWEKLEKVLGSTREVFYSPTGLLYKVAFHAIQHQDKLLLDTYQLHQLNSTKVLCEDYQPTSFEKTWQINLFGGIDYGKSNGELEWPFLTGTENEVAEIGKMFSTTNVRVFKGGEASEVAFKKQSSQSPPIIHLATHGYFSEKNKSDNTISFLTSSNALIRSGLLLAGANQAWGNTRTPSDQEDGVLTAYELANLDLSKTKLAVLSACETGLGDISNTEGVFGLQRALKMAGVEQYIISLWEVPDKETQELMTIFYKKLVEGTTIQDAFTHAQREMRKKYSPYFWAAFVLVR